MKLVHITKFLVRESAGRRKYLDTPLPEEMFDPEVANVAPVVLILGNDFEASSSDQAFTNNVWSASIVLA